MNKFSGQLAPASLRRPPVIPESESFDEKQYNATFNDHDLLQLSPESSAESSRDAPAPVHQSTAIRAEPNLDQQKQNVSACQESLQLSKSNDRVTAVATEATNRERTATQGPTKRSTPVKENFDANLPTASTISGNKRRTTGDFETSSTTGARSKVVEISLNAEQDNLIGAENRSTAKNRDRILQSTPVKEHLTSKPLSASTISGKTLYLSRELIRFYYRTKKKN